MDILSEVDCAACQAVTRCVRIPIKPWFKTQKGKNDREVHLCRRCLEKAMLTIRPFSITPRPFVDEDDPNGLFGPVDQGVAVWTNE